MSALSRDEIRGMIQASDARGWLAVGTTWAMIAGSLAAAAWAWETGGAWAWTVIPLALVILGGRHLALAILMHDASHYSLFRTRALNDLVGAWLCGYPTWQDLARYRVHHMAHHKYAGSERDPDLTLVARYPTTRRSLARKLLRDLTGVTGLKRLYGLVLMDLGLIKYTVAGDVVPLRPRGPVAWRCLAGVALTNAALFGALWVAGAPWAYAFWVLSYMTTFSVILRVRSIAEHACTEQGLEPVLNTRTTHAGWLARLTVAPHRVNYHLEHHLLMTVPYFRLPELHRLLRDRGALSGAHVARGYVEVLRLASSRR